MEHQLSINMEMMILFHTNIGYAFYVKNNENRLIFITFRFSNEKLY